MMMTMMDIVQKAYKDLEAVIEKNRSFKSNLMVISVPGLGASYLLKTYVGRNPDVHYLTRAGQNPGLMNVIDLVSPGDWRVVDGYFKEARGDQKFVWLISDPALTNDEEFNRSSPVLHTYETYLLGARDKEDTALICRETNPDLTDEEVETIYGLSGGIPTLIKWLAGSKIRNKPEKELAGEADLIKMIERTLKVCSSCSDEFLEKLELKNNGRYRSSLMELVKG